MTLVCYLDDSGTDAENPLVTLAGYVGTVHSWGAFEQEAQKVADSFGVAHIRGMDLWKTRGEYRSWPRARKADFVRAINQALAPHVGLGVSFSTLKSVYEERARGRTRVQSSFGFCFETLIDRLLKDEGFRTVMRGGHDATLSFRIEAGNAHNAEVLQRYDRLVLRHGKELPFLTDMIEVPKNSSFAIQVADLYAFLTRRQAVAMERNGRQPVDHDPLLTQLRHQIRDIGWASTDFWYED